MQKLPDVTQAVARGEAVVVCVYDGWVPKDIASQLPADFNATSWAAEIRDGAIVRIIAGPPERAVVAVLAAKP